MCDLNTIRTIRRTDEERRRCREGGRRAAPESSGQRRESGEERRGGDKLPIKWVSGIWDAIAYRVRALISDLIAAQLSGNTKHSAPTLEIMLKEISVALFQFLTCKQYMNMRDLPKVGLGTPFSLL